MALIWSDFFFATGVAEVDEQHKVLFDKINALLDACSRGRGQDEVLPLLDFLGAYVANHFRCEEGAMEKRCPPTTCAANRAAHEQFRKDFELLRNRAAREGATLDLTRDLQRRVGDWLTSHIMKLDTRMRTAVGEPQS